ncbi:MAG TPA: hypothetical protein VHY91_12020 [Pirellulales bacterium]|jgi:hypothetical protein|nr:hypothetical protein [Pirellulales bacterium]
MFAQIKENRAPWLAMSLCALLAVFGVVLTVFSDSTWKVALLIVIPLCFIAAEVAIFRMHEQIGALRLQVSRLREVTGPAPDSAKDGSPKGVYSVDEAGQRRLHMSRLE